MRLACAMLGFALLPAVRSEPRGADVVHRVERAFGVPRQGLRVEATIADVTIVGSSRTDVAVEIVRRAPSGAELARFPEVIESDADRIRLSVLQERDGRDPRLKSEIIVKGPATLRVDAVRVFEGRVRVNGLVEQCDVDVRRGAIDAADVAGRIRLETGLGGIDVTRATLVPGGMMRLRTFNGPVRLQLARPPENARILALTFNGTITSEVPLAMKDRFGPRFGETTIGNGEPIVSIDVVTGDIAIGVRR